MYGTGFVPVFLWECEVSAVDGVASRDQAESPLSSYPFEDWMADMPEKSSLADDLITLGFDSDGNHRPVLLICSSSDSI
jgi:hypothetical protein